mgnify:FL=1
MKHLLMPIVRLLAVLIGLIVMPIVFIILSFWDFKFKRRYDEYIDAFTYPLSTEVDEKTNEIYYNWSFVDYIFDIRTTKRKN